jgi:hypothetical protein
MGVGAVLLATACGILATSRTEGASASPDVAQETSYEYKLLYAPVAFSREKTPTGEIRGNVVLNEFAADGWEYAGSFGPEANTLVLKRHKKK